MQAPWSPPGWVFGPAWIINNFFILLALQKILRSDMPQRKKLLILQGFIWLIFFSFGYVYFNKKSAILATIWTVSDLLLATNSFLTARKSKENISSYYVPLMLWTSFASSLAIYQALYNDDPVFEIGAVMGRES